MLLPLTTILVNFLRMNSMSVWVMWWNRYTRKRERPAVDPSSKTEVVGEDKEEKKTKLWDSGATEKSQYGLKESNT